MLGAFSPFPIGFIVVFKSTVTLKSFKEQYILKFPKRSSSRTLFSKSQIAESRYIFQSLHQCIHSFNKIINERTNLYVIWYACLLVERIKMSLNNKKEFIMYGSQWRLEWCNVAMFGLVTMTQINVDHIAHGTLHWCLTC